MFSFNKQILFGCIVAILTFKNTSYAFAPSTPRSITSVAASTTTTTAINAEPESDSLRRNFLGTVKRFVLGGATAAAIKRNAPALAAEETTGRIVEMQVANLGGEVGKSGTVKIQLRPEWAPRGVSRFEELVDSGFYNNCRFFRVLPGFIAQFGINGSPDVMSKWRSSNIPDDPVKVSNARGTVVFATAGKNTRTTQIFVNTRNQGNDFLDRQGFSPFGEVIEGMDIIDQLYSGYGEGAPSGKGPNQGLIQAKGNTYLEASYPKLSYISDATFAK